MGDERPRGLSTATTPALFLVWMIVGVTLLLPELEPHRLELVPIATLPAMAALWRQYRSRGDLWPVPVGVLWGALMVVGHQTVIPNLPATLVGEKRIIQGVVADRDDRGDSTLLTLDRVESGDWRASGLVRVHFNALRKGVQLPTVLPGDRVQFPARLRQLSGFRNPGGFDYRSYLLEQGVMATGSATASLLKTGETGDWYWNRLRQKVADWIAVTLPSSQRGLAEALLVGKRGHLDSALQEALFVSGTYHLISISGLHMSLVGGSVYYLLRLLLVLILPASRRWDMKQLAALLSLPPIVAYASLAGWSVPVQRAFIMVGLFLLAVAMRRRRQSWRILTLAAILILSWQPQQLMNAGFQLSFLCVVVILYCMERLPIHGWRGWLIFMVGSTVAVELATAPVSLYSFHRFSPYGILVNPLAIPWVGEISTPLGLLAMVIQPLWPTGADTLLALMGWTLEPYRWLIEWTVTLPGAYRRSAGPALPGLALFLAAGFVAGTIRSPGPWWWKRVLCTVVALLGLWWPRDFGGDQRLRLMVLDVGQALSLVVKMPHGGWTVVDSGGVATPRFNVGEGVTSATLWHYGVERLERVVVSHPQADHMSGVEQLLKNFAVGSLWLARMTREEMDSHSIHQLLESAQRLRVPVRFFDHAEEIRDGEGVLRVLSPMPVKGVVNLNNRSLAVELVYGAHRFLLSGDMETKEESWLVSQGALRPVTVLLAPHHGSMTSSSLPFVQALRPEHVVFSVGLDNQWGFPKPEVVRRWQGVGARLWRTDTDGAVIFASDGRQLEVTTAK
ncbi:MAG: DNA internalization-related competence protein ComEC/Rec2 [Magnetococcales bacterium]|nr:DNA internalization-related competence protein ComEC/Rec2 [Magnetococcales bacterium]